MCIILYAPKGEITPSHLAHGLENNPDGWGYMFNYGRETVVRKGMDAADFWKSWKRDCWEFSGRPVVFHARWATHGPRVADNCHPFPVQGHNLHMAHNGIIRNVAADAQLSDTRVFVRDILEKMPKGFLRWDGITAMMAHYIGHSKLVFLDVRDKVTIIGANLGHWIDGPAGKVWASNSTYQEQKPVFLAPAPAESKKSKCRKRQDKTDALRNPLGFDPFPWPNMG